VTAFLCTYFLNIVVLDFEYEIEDGGLPRVLCMVAYVLDAELRHVRTIRLWRGEFGSTPPFDIGPDTLVVGYSLWAEMTCFLQLGWRFPVHVYDLHTAWLATSNILLPYEPDEVRKKPRKRLSDACRAYGIEGWENIDKPEMAKAIGEGRWREYGQPAVLQYCEEDVSNSTKLLYRQLLGYRHYAPVDPQRVMDWSNYSAKTVARIQAHGMSIDTPLWNLVQENKAAVVAALIRKFDPSQGSEYPIYSPDGEFSSWRFEHWLGRPEAMGGAGVAYWPRLESGALQLDGDAFRMMYNAHPAIEDLHALRESLGVIVRARIPIGPDGRNRPSLFPFGTATGRNAQAKSLFNAHASMRSFLIAPPGKILLYLDWRTQEVGVAAQRCGDRALMEDYASGDVYHALAKLCGLTDDPDIKHWKANNSDQRQRMKALQLGINYGMGVSSLSRGLGRHPLIGSEVIIRHKQRHTTFWPWREATVERAMLERVIYSEFDGWPLHLSTSPNKRTIYNFPMQSGGAEMLRLSANRLCDAGLVPSMLVHDGILFELDNEEQVAHAKEIMQAAGTEVCGGFKIGVDVDQKLIGGAHYRDKRPVAQKMWAVVMDVLRELGAISGEAG
jgi:DNA polymerase family A